MFDFFWGVFLQRENGKDEAERTGIGKETKLRGVSVICKI